MRKAVFSAAALAAVMVLAHTGLEAGQAVDPTKVDAVFARWTSSTPGCAVGVGVGGRSVLEKAYGMADLEHDVPNKADTIFEAGSVSKQFTAMAVLLLAAEGKLSIDDPARKYVPELPDYGVPLTIRHMLTHTSGLRDWGSLEGIAGWPRTTRTYTHAHVVEILGMQKALNFTPGSHYSYSNSGYNLAAVIVSRVGGMPFAEFSQKRIFQPLGMTRTSWRDDFTRIVKDRAIAYSGSGAGLRQDMPFENVHGNGGLLTTVGDLLKWNENFVSPKVGDAALVARQQALGKFTSGVTQSYASGLMVGMYKGLPEVSHSGSTAGYRAFLTRFQDPHVSVAVLCNAGTADATAAAHAVGDLYLAGKINPNAPRPPAVAETRSPLTAIVRDDSFKPSATELATFTGTYVSDEIETTLVVEVRNGELVVKRRPDSVIPLRPHSRDRFDAGGGIGLMTFHRAGGRVTEVGITQDRVWDLRFRRQ
ncbi:MAG TPA: serine hydrolase domain-containing protein [Vicinamibacterales bacterium]|nr:serine hydrolase domain-containing protein [Vicinamibacterales bacterium]